ncbi:hypothetical protein BDK92_7150 [Micromonospora pisi]|uniref:Uncharacterized protein n=1 Tax=Micromonospora pisi TaxID=589240 RepID=A0A495JWP1_9ACTN|nr:hypothetical protein [Micromonospora pisi]RKR92674.1 hypothetical protein BDK92_7150 [Micromonospora pisi]
MNQIEPIRIDAEPRPAVWRSPSINSACPNPDADPSQVVVEAWQNFMGPEAEYRERMGAMAGPAHTRIVMEHSCGWTVSLPPGPLSWSYLADAITEHFPDADNPTGEIADTDAKPALPTLGRSVGTASITLPAVTGPGPEASGECPKCGKLHHPWCPPYDKPTDEPTPEVVTYHVTRGPGPGRLEAEPGPEVTEVWDCDGDQWKRVTAGWIPRSWHGLPLNDDFGYPSAWRELVQHFGPITTRRPA